MEAMELKSRLSLALEIAAEAGRLTLAHFCRADLVVEHKTRQLAGHRRRPRGRSAPASAHRRGVSGRRRVGRGDGGVGG